MKSKWAYHWVRKLNLLENFMRMLNGWSQLKMTLLQFANHTDILHIQVSCNLLRGAKDKDVDPIIIHILNKLNIKFEHHCDYSILNLIFQCDLAWDKAVVLQLVWNSLIKMALILRFISNLFSPKPKKNHIEWKWNNDGRTDRTCMTVIHL